LSAATDRGLDEVCGCHLFGGLGGDRRIQRLELLVLSDEFADNGHRSPGDCEVALPSRNLKGCDTGFGGCGVEVERQCLQGWMLVGRSGKVGGGRGDPREREALRSQRRVDLGLDLCVQIGVDGVHTILTEVILHPANDDFIGEVRIRDERHSRVQRGLLDAADAGRVTSTIVSDDGVEHGGDDIGLSLVLRIADEVGGRPSVGVWHIVKRLDSVDGDLASGSVDNNSPKSTGGRKNSGTQRSGSGEVGIGGSVCSDVVGRRSDYNLTG